MMRRDYDVVIVGSGAGGGTVAARLIPMVAKGARIAILEAGPHYDHDYFTQREIEMMGLLCNTGAWPVEDGSITLAAGKGVGGSTLMYTGVTFRLPDPVVEQWGIDGIDAADLHKRFDRLEKELGVIEPDETMVNDNNRLFRQACEKLGWPVQKLRLNIKECDQMGFCNLGCTKGAKQGTLEVQLPQALAAGVELVPNCEVHSIAGRKLFATVKPAPPGTRPGPWPAGKTEISAKTVVLAAGSPGSAAILLRSGFRRRLSTLGCNLTLHPAMTVYGIHREVISNYRGLPKNYYTSKFSKSHGYYLETAFYYPFMSTKHLGLWGKELTDTMKSYSRLMAILILNHDPVLPKNRIAVSRNGDIKLYYTIAAETISSLCHAQAQAARIFFAAGCEKVVVPCAGKAVLDIGEISDQQLEDIISPENFIPNKTPVSSAHPQGGCRMGSGPENSVTNCWGQVHNHPWLYVADASLFPSSSHVNPYLTVMALADRVGEHICEMAGTGDL